MRTDAFAFRALVLVFAFCLAGCSPKPYQTTPLDVCGGYFSEHDIEHDGDFWVSNAPDGALVFHYTNVSSKPALKPVWAVASQDSLYYIHIQYNNVTVGCLDPTRFPDWKGEQPDLSVWGLAPGQTVEGRFEQTRVLKAMKESTPSVVLQPGSIVRFNFDGFASNPCAVERGSEGLQLRCASSTRAQRLEENRSRRSWWDRLTGSNQKEVLSG